MKDYNKCSIIAKILKEISDCQDVRIIVNSHEQYATIITIYRHGNKTTQYMTKIPLCEYCWQKQEN